jgi:hypothetical protein
LDLQHDLYLEHDLQVALMSDPQLHLVVVELHLVLVQKKMKQV